MESTLMGMPLIGLNLPSRLFHLLWNWAFTCFPRHLETELKSCENPVTCCFFMVPIEHLPFWHPLTSFDQVVLLVCRFVSNLASRFLKQHPKRCHSTVWRQEDPFVMSNMGHTWATMVALNPTGDSEDSSALLGRDAFENSKGNKFLHA